MSGDRDAAARRVVVTGTGLVSALGASPADLLAALAEGRSALRPVTSFDAAAARCRQAAAMIDFEPAAYLTDRSLHPLDRTSRLAASAAALALEASGWGPEARTEHEVGLVLGTMFGSVHTISEFDRKAITAGPGYAKPMSFANSVINAAAGQTAIWHNLRGINATVSGGASSGLQALATAVDLIRSGRAEVVVAGGAEELCFESFLAFDRAGLLCRADDGAAETPVPLHARRNGFVLGEAAGLLVLEERHAALARGAPLLGEIRGHGGGFDCARGHDRDSAAAAVAAAVRTALHDAAADAAAIDCLSLSASGSVAGDAIEAQGIATELGAGVSELPVTAIKSMLGETLGAGGALQTIAMIESMRAGVLPGICGLDELDEEIPLRAAARPSRRFDGRLGLVTSAGLTGGHCCLVVAGGEHRDEPPR